MQDNEIVELYFNRNENAISKTDEKYGAYLTTIAYNITSDTEDSKEAVNDTYLAAWNSIPPQKPSVLRTFLSKITRRISIDIVRKNTRKKRGVSQYELTLAELEGCIGREDTQDELEARILGEAISAFLRSLSNDARSAFICRYYFLDSMHDTAKYLGMTEAKLKSLLFRTRASLREYLQKEGFEV